jgi:hypothetical protein
MEFHPSKDLMLHRKLLEQEQTKPKTSKRKVITIQAEINKIETKKKNRKNQQNKKLVL